MGTAALETLQISFQTEFNSKNFGDFFFFLGFLSRTFRIIGQVEDGVHFVTLL